MPGFDLLFDPATDFQKKAATNRKLISKLAEQLPGAARFDPASGAVQLDGQRLQRDLGRLLPRASAANFGRNLLDSTAAGMAVFRSQAHPEHGTAIPWLVLEDVAYALQGLPAAVRGELGVTLARTASDATRLLRERFPGVPGMIFSGGRGGLLIRDPRALPSDGPPVPDPETKPPRPPGHAGNPAHHADFGATIAGIVPLWHSDVSAAANCFVNGNWSGWWEGWTGWLPGFKVCLDHDCADKLANILGGFGGGGAFLDEVATLAQQGLAAALQTAAAVAIGIIAFALAVNIKLVNGPNGACIYCSWPYTGGIVFWAMGS
jgi:hypothetical protein